MSVVKQGSKPGALVNAQLLAKTSACASVSRAIKQGEKDSTLSQARGKAKHIRYRIDVYRLRDW